MHTIAVRRAGSLLWALPALLFHSACGVKMLNEGAFDELTSSPVSASAPQLASFFVNEISPTANQPIALVYGSVFGAYSEYCILENSSDSAGCTWINGTLPPTYSVLEDDGSISLTIFLKNDQGAVSNAAVSNVVTVDRIAPILASASVTTSSPTSNSLYPLSFGAITGSYSSYCIRENNTDPAGCSWVAGTLPSIYSVSSTENAKVLSVWIRDPAGNLSTRVDTNSVTYDGTAPVLASVDITNSSPTNSTTYNLSYGAITGTYVDYCIRENNTSIAGCVWVNAALPASQIVSATENAKTLSFWLRDGAGNVSARVNSDTVTLDTTPPVVSLQSLTGGQTIGGGSSVSVTWSASDANFGASPISISVSSDGGATYGVLSASEADDGTYTWSVPVVNSGTYRIRVTATDLAGNSTSDSSASNFTINSSTPVVSVTSPNGGEFWRSGTSHAITWTSSGLPGGASSAKIEYSIDGGSTFSLIANGEANDGTYTWTVPAVGAGNSDTRVRVTITDSLAVDTADVSDSHFSIDNTAPVATLTSLVGGESLVGGGSVAITWTATDAHDGGGLGSTPISLEVSSDSGATWTSIASNLSNTLSYNWSIPAVTSKTYRVRVTATDRAGWTNASSSSSDFWINSTTPVVALTAPNGGELLKGTQSTNITWTSSGLPSGGSSVALDYSTDNGSTWTQISASEPNNGTYAWTVPAVDSSTARVRVTVTDSFNVATPDASNAAFSIDSSSPTISLTSLDGGQVVGSGSIQNITWTASDTHFGSTPIQIEYSTNAGTSWSTLVAATANNGSYPWTVPSVADGSTYRFRITATDLVGWTAFDVGTDIRIDNAGPTFVAGTFLINGSATPPATKNNTVQIALQSQDAWSNIHYFCLKDTSTAPTSSDSCWTAVNALGGVASNNVSITNGYYTTEFVPDTYTIYVWAKDEWGFISTLTAAGAGTSARDKNTIAYTPGTPASVLDVIAANTDTPSNPVTVAERSAPSGSSIYVKWKITDDLAIPAGSVALYYTTDETNFTPIASGLDNASNGGCSLTGTATGCYRWTNGSPTNTYLRIRVGVTDSDGIVSFGSGSALNTGNFSVIAGNIDDGREGSAQAAFFFTQAQVNQSTNADKKSLVVTSNGTIYLKDALRGILKIDPVTRSATTFLRVTGSSTGDGGNVASATLRTASMITLDFQDRLLIWDHNRIRRVNLDQSPATIETIIGGGGSTADTVAALSISLPSLPWSTRDGFAHGLGLFEPLPNGDLIFSTDISWLLMTGTTGGTRFRHYHSGTGQVTSIRPQGTGAQSDSGRVLSGSYFMWGGFTFDPVTSALGTGVGIIADNVSGNWQNFKGMNFNPTTGVSNGASPHAASNASTYSQDIMHLSARNGRLYQWSRKLAQIKLYNSTTNTWSNIVNASYGYCASGTTATACNTRLDDVFVSSSGRVFVLDNGMIRVVDKNGKMQTIYGQSAYTGDGGQAISARLLDPDWIERRADGKLIFPDHGSAQLWEMSIGGTINKIAGNGTLASPAIGPLATATSFSYKVYSSYAGMGVNPANGDVYLRIGNNVGRLNRSTSKWEYLVGTNVGGTRCYSDSAADGIADTKFSGTSGSVDCTGAAVNIFGFDGTNVLVQSTSNYGNQNHNPMYKLFNVSTKVQTHLAGGLVSGITVPSRNFCAAGSTVSTCTTLATSDLAQRFHWHSGGYWVVVGVGRYDLKTMTPGGNFATYDTLNVAREVRGYAIREGTPDVIYYCNDVNQQLYKKIKGGAETVLSFGSSTIQCSSETVTWDSARSTVIFGISQNGLGAVAEYYDP